MRPTTHPPRPRRDRRTPLLAGLLALGLLAGAGTGLGADTASAPKARFFASGGEAVAIHDFDTNPVPGTWHENWMRTPWAYGSVNGELRLWSGTTAGAEALLGHYPAALGGDHAFVQFELRITKAHFFQFEAFSTGQPIHRFSVNGLSPRMCASSCANLDTLVLGADYTVQILWGPGTAHVRVLEASGALRSQATLNSALDPTMITLVKLGVKSPSPGKESEAFVDDFRISRNPLSLVDIQFRDASAPGAGITSWAWTFGEGSTSSASDPVHAMKRPGLRTVCLTVTGPGGSDQACQKVFVVNRPPIPDFAGAQADPSILDHKIAFTDLSTDADGDVVAWAWSFGDGATSTERHPTHTFAECGQYTVALTATDDMGAKATRTRVIQVYNVLATPPAGPTVAVCVHDLLP